MPSRKTSAILGLVVVVTLQTLAACSGGAAAPQVSDAWARPAANGMDTAAYFTVTGAPGQADALLSVSSPAADMVQIHETSTDADGMTGMHPIDRVEIPAGETVTFEPGGLHLMIMGLPDPLVGGSTLELDLVFERAGTVVVQASVPQG